jgi:hypothetical protein
MKLVKESLNEFKQGGDPYTTMGIGSNRPLSDIDKIKLLHNLSSEKLNYEDLWDYLSDYYLNPEEYDIDTDSAYYDAIQWAHDLHSMSARDLYNMYTQTYEQMNESKKFDELSNYELKDIFEKDPESKDGVFAKTELKRRKEVNGEDINEFQQGQDPYKAMGLESDLPYETMRCNPNYPPLKYVEIELGEEHTITIFEETIENVWMIGYWSSKEHCEVEGLNYDEYRTARDAKEEVLSDPMFYIEKMIEAKEENES